MTSQLLRLCAVWLVWAPRPCSPWTATTSHPIHFQGLSGNYFFLLLFNAQNVYLLRNTEIWWDTFLFPTTSYFRMWNADVSWFKSFRAVFECWMLFIQTWQNRLKGSKLQDHASQLPFPKGKYKHPIVHTETSVLCKIVWILGRA